jgi:death-on-curing protein
MSRRWTWIQPAVLLAAHDEQLAEHGGPPGLRDAAMLDSALARAQHLAAYGQPDAAALAAAYGFGLARNHPFVDGNKRTAFMAIELFLTLNGHELRATDHDCVLTMLALAAGDLSEDALADWIRGHLG